MNKDQFMVPILAAGFYGSWAYAINDNDNVALTVLVQSFVSFFTTYGLGEAISRSLQFFRYQSAFFFDINN